MKLRLLRIAQTPEYTIGRLFIDNVYYCNTLEDTVRDLTTEKKIPSKTAIPEGTYPVIVNYSPKFKRELPRLLDVPFFDGILIHRGNTASDSAGCILVGENKVKGEVINSTRYEIELTAKLKNAQKSGESIDIEILNCK